MKSHDQINEIKNPSSRFAKAAVICLLLGLPLTALAMLMTLAIVMSWDITAIEGIDVWQFAGILGFILIFVGNICTVLSWMKNEVRGGWKIIATVLSVCNVLFVIYSIVN